MTLLFSDSSRTEVFKIPPLTSFGSAEQYGFALEPSTNGRASGTNASAYTARIEGIVPSKDSSAEETAQIKDVE